MGSLFEQAHCTLISIDNCEHLLPAFPGELLTCASEIVFTASHNLEVKSLVWAEDVISSGKRLICKASTWFSATSVLSDTKSVKVPKLQLPDLRAEKEGLIRFETLKEERRNAIHNSINLQSRTFSLVEAVLNVHEGSKQHTAPTSKSSQTLLTHIACLNDCTDGVYMDCGVLAGLMYLCATQVGLKHSRAAEMSLACCYSISYLDTIPKDSFLLIYGRLTFTSKKLMEVEVIVDMEVIQEQNIDNRRVASGFFCLLALNENGRILNIPSLKIMTNEEEITFLEGQKRYEVMKRHLRYTENRMAATTSVANKDAVATESSHKNESLYSTKRYNKVNYTTPLSASE